MKQNKIKQNKKRPPRDLNPYITDQKSEALPLSQKALLINNALKGIEPLFHRLKVWYFTIKLESLIDNAFQLIIFGQNDQHFYIQATININLISQKKIKDLLNYNSLLMLLINNELIFLPKIQNNQIIIFVQKHNNIVLLIPQHKYDKILLNEQILIPIHNMILYFDQLNVLFIIISRFLFQKKKIESMQNSWNVKKQNFQINIENDLLCIQGSNKLHQFQINLQLQIDWIEDFSGFTVHSIHVKTIIIEVMNCNYQLLFENVKLIDKGEQSIGVYDSVRLADKQKFATKILRKNYGIPQEIKLLNRFNHQNIVKPRYFYTNQYIVFEKLQNLQKPKDEIQLQNQFKQLFKAVEYIHKQGFMHRDIKPKNIMQNKNSQVQLIDLGLVVKQSKTELKQSGTPGYIAPEIFKGPNYNQKADMFSLGAVFYELNFDQPLIPRHNKRVLRNKLFKLENCSFPGLSDLAQDFLLNHLIEDPNQRINIQQSLNTYFDQEDGAQETRYDQQMQKYNHYFIFYVIIPGSLIILFNLVLLISLELGLQQKLKLSFYKIIIFLQNHPKTILQTTEFDPMKCYDLLITEHSSIHDRISFKRLHIILYNSIWIFLQFKIKEIQILFIKKQALKQVEPLSHKQKVLYFTIKLESFMDKQYFDSESKQDTYLGQLNNLFINKDYYNQEKNQKKLQKMQKSCSIHKQNFKIIIENDLLCILGTNQSYQFQINLFLQIDWMANFSGFTIHSIDVRLSEQSGLQIFNLLASRVMNCNYQLLFENVKLIDKGRQSIGVYDSVRLVDNQQFATKILRKIYGIPQEIKLLNRFNHENIVKPRYFFMDDTNYYIVFEKLQNIQKPKDEIQLQKQFKQLLKAVEYIHKQGYIHRDIKPKNIMQDKNSQVQLIDLGLVVKQSKSELKQSGTPGYIAPEIFKGPHYNQKADMFSLGAVFYELQKTQLIHRYFDQPLILQHNVRLRNQFFQLKNYSFIGVSDLALDFLLRHLVEDPDLRINIQQSLNHAYFDQEDGAQQIRQLSPKLLSSLDVNFKSN
ncbi:hypothetical protein pb186bvf_004938 [Paramecium bursaria]